MREELIERFFRYVKIDTTADGSAHTSPSSEGQIELGKILAEELIDLGITDATVTEHGIVYGTIPSNVDHDVPVIGLMAHLDTSDAESGENVTPVMHTSYHGRDIILPADNSQVISVEQNPDLKDFVGEDLITANGTTLLGADDKAGIAEIMTMIAHLKENPQLKHGKVRIAFTPDEEIGRGVDHMDQEEFGADFAYTLDGTKMGGIENQTFNAYGATFTIEGMSVHPGYAKNKMVSAVRIAAEIPELLKGQPVPETTEGTEGFIDTCRIEGTTGHASVHLMVRDFDEDGAQEKIAVLEGVKDTLAERHPKAKIQLKIIDGYHNMKEMLDTEPRVVDYAIEAVKRTGIEPFHYQMRGGTDGARLSFEGLLTPNIFAGGMNFHSKLEWVPVIAMEKATETLIQLVQVWAEKS